MATPVLRRLAGAAAMALCLAPISPSMSDAQGPSLPPEIVGPVWEWVSFTTPVEELVIDAPERYTLQFDAGGRIALRADCNRGTGGYKADGHRIALGSIALTRAMCPPGSHSDSFVRALGRAATWFTRDGDFFLEFRIDSGTLRFRKQD